MTPNGPAVWLVAVCEGLAWFLPASREFYFYSSIHYLACKNHDSYARGTAKTENYNKSRILLLAEAIKHTVRVISSCFYYNVKF